MLEVKNGHFYTGYTNDLERRYREHQKGTSASKYTRSFGPVRLVQAWTIKGKQGEAMKVEALIKRQSRKTKETLVQKPRLLKKLALEKLNLKTAVCFVNKKSM